MAQIRLVFSPALDWHLQRWEICCCKRETRELLRSVDYLKKMYNVFNGFTLWIKPSTGTLTSIIFSVQFRSTRDRPHFLKLVRSLMAVVIKKHFSALLPRKVNRVEVAFQCITDAGFASRLIIPLSVVVFSTQALKRVDCDARWMGSPKRQYEHQIIQSTEAHDSRTCP